MSVSISWDTAVTLWETQQGTLSGAWDRFLGWGTEADAQRSADAVQAFIADHNESIEDYINARTTATTGFDTVAVEFRDDSGSDTRYIVAGVTEGNYTNGRMVTTTDRDVDETCELSGQAVANAEDELSTVYDQYIENDSDLGVEPLAELNSQYQPDVACSFFMPDL